MGFLMGLLAMLNKSLIQFSVDGWGCVPSLLFDLRPNFGEGNEDNGDLLQNVPCTHCYTQCPQPCSRLLLSHASTGDSWILTGKSWSVSGGGHCSFLLGLGAHKSLFVSSRVLCKFWWLCGRLLVTSSKRAYAIPRSAAPRAPAPAAGHC